MGLPRGPSLFSLNWDNTCNHGMGGMTRKIPNVQTILRSISTAGWLLRWNRNDARQIEASFLCAAPSRLKATQRSLQTF